MSDHATDSDPRPEGKPDSSIDPSSPPEARAAITTSGFQVGRLWTLAVAAGLIAGLLAWAVEEGTYGMYTWNDAAPVKRAHKAELAKMGPYEQTAFITKTMFAQRAGWESFSTAVAFGTLGGLLGLALGLAGGMAAGSLRSGIAGGFLGMVLAAGGAVLLSYLIVPYYYKFLSPTSGLEIPLLSHGAILAILGAASGLALGVGLGGRHVAIRTLLWALSGAIIATIVFEIIGALAFMQEAEPSLVPSDRVARGLLDLSTALLVAGFAAFGAASARSDSAGRQT
jgi:hypothetical protein